MNEWYLRDLSRKQKTAIRVKGESGKPTTNCAIYGYKKMPGDKYSWYIDEEAAAVVRRIFRLTSEGNGPYDIARILYDDKVETPAGYAAKQGRGVWKSKEEFPNPYNWSGYIVGQILSMPEYMGHTVNFRSHKQSYKDKNPVMNPQEDWLIFCTGVIPAIDVAVKRMTNVGDNVVVQTPVYNIFYNCVEIHGSHVLE